MRTKEQINVSRIKFDKRITKAALRELKAALQAMYGPDIPRIMIYGSRARGEARANSDIDVLLLFRGPVHPGQEIKRISPVLAELNLRYQVLISVLPVAEESYELSPGAFWSNLRHEAVSIDAI